MTIITLCGVLLIFSAFLLIPAGAFADSAANIQPGSASTSELNRFTFIDLPKRPT